ncbi:MAG: DUF3090 family protein [Actinobacteria bacterium]|nr:DUF3090 family protein [Actinomycetota bacterium]
MRSLGRVGHLAAGAVGPPGRRIFYLEVGSAEDRECFLLEKEQVAALAAHGLELAGAEAGGGPGPSPGPPGEPTFRVAEIGLGTDGDEIVVLLSPADGPEPVAFTVPAEVFAAMARQALEVVAAGRPPCRLCGLPLDPDGHACPGGNGDLRRR